jgi:hypothetical protein
MIKLMQPRVTIPSSCDKRVVEISNSVWTQQIMSEFILFPQVKVLLSNTYTRGGGTLPDQVSGLLSPDARFYARHAPGNDPSKSVGKFGRSNLAAEQRYYKLGC